MNKLASAFLGLAVLVAVQTASAENAIKPELGMRLVFSPDYNDAITDSYSDRDISGGYGWIGLHFGLKFQLAETIVVTPRVALLVNAVSESGGDAYMNSIVQPALAARLLFTKGSSFYLEGEISHNTVNTGSDDFDVDGGVGYAGLFGYQWDSGFDLGLGYSVIPTDVSNDDGVTDYNFGGLEFRFSGSF